MRDMHIHTGCSCDSEAKMEDYILEAKKQGITTICFTDHVDLNTNDYVYDYYSATEFWKKYNEVKNKGDSGLEVLAGIEFGEPHLYGERLAELARYPYDFILAKQRAKRTCLHVHLATAAGSNTPPLGADLLERS